MAQKNNRPGVAAEQAKEDNDLVLYRLKEVENAVKEVGSKVENLDHIKKSDLVELRDTVLERFNEVRLGLQKQIDDNQTETKDSLKLKADAKDLKDLKSLVYSAIGFFVVILGSVITYYLTSGAK